MMGITARDAFDAAGLLFTFVMAWFLTDILGALTR